MDQEGTKAPKETYELLPQDQMTDSSDLNNYRKTNSMKTSGSLMHQYLAAATVNIAAIACGIGLGWTSPTIPVMSDPNETPLNTVLDSDTSSWVGSLLALGAALGPFGAGFAADKMGRKLTLLVSATPFLVTWFLTATTCNLLQIYVARFLCGIGVGGIFTVLPMYVGEISDPSIRGALGSFMQLFITFGLLYAYAIGPYVSFQWFGVACFIVPVVYLIAFAFIPESPYFFLAQNKREEAEDSLHWLRGLSGEALQKETAAIKETVDIAMKEKGTIKDIFKSKATTKALILSLGLVAGQQLSGINVILFYATTIFQAAGSAIEPAICTIIVGIVQVLSSGVTPVVVDRLGRRFLLLMSAVGMALSQAVLGLYFYLQTHGSDVSGISFLPILCLVVYNIVYSTGYGPLPWAVSGEIFPANTKSIASSLTASFCWILGFLITKFFSSISESLGMAGAFWIFTGFCVVSAVFVFFLLPETKGKTLQEIQDMLGR